MHVCRIGFCLYGKVNYCCLKFPYSKMLLLYRYCNTYGQNGLQTPSTVRLDARFRTRGIDCCLIKSQITYAHQTPVTLFAELPLAPEQNTLCFPPNKRRLTVASSNSVSMLADFAYRNYIQPTTLKYYYSNVAF